MKKIIVAFMALHTVIIGFSQEKKNELKEVVIEKKKTKAGKVIEERKITTENNGIKTKTTIIVDGNKITVDGKAIDEMNEKEIDLIVEDALDELKEMMPKNKKLKKVFKDYDGSKKINEFKRSEFKINYKKNQAFLGVTSNNTNEGALVESVQENSSAEKIGLEKGDVITKINDFTIDNKNNLYTVIGKFKPNDTVTIYFKRNDKVLNAVATLQENNNENLFEIEMGPGTNFSFPREIPMFKNDFYNSNKPKLGIKIQDVEDTDGVEVLDVTENSVAAKVGLQKGDIIKIIDTETIKNVDNFKQKSSTLKDGDSLKLAILRKGKQEEIILKLPKKLKTAEL